MSRAPQQQAAGEPPADAAPGGHHSSQSAHPPNAKRAPATAWWRGLLPLAVAVALMAVVLARVDWTTFTAHLGAVNHWAFLAFMAGFVLALLSADALATSYVYRRWAVGLRYRELWVVRGASYLPSMLNHHVGQAWITYFLSRAYGVDLRRMAGATLLVYASWAGCMVALASIGVLTAGLPAGWLALPLGAGVCYLALLVLRPKQLARGRLLAPLFEAGIAGHLSAMLVRLPHLVVLFVGTWAPFWFFDVQVPIGAALLFVPILMVAVTIPITPQGVGTRDALAATFFVHFAAAPTHSQRLAAIVACTAATAVALLVVEAIIGLALLPRASRLLGGALPEGQPTP